MPTLCAGKLALLAALMCLCAIAVADAAPIKIVAVGASNTSGWGVGTEQAYPAQLQALLRARGVDAHVINAGTPFDTTSHMRRRLQIAVPHGTHIVILQPGANDLRFFGTKQQRSANIAAMVNELHTRKIRVVVYDEVIPDRYYALDHIHLTVDGHAMIAAYLLPRVLDIVRRPQKDKRAPYEQARAAAR